MPQLRGCVVVHAIGTRIHVAPGLRNWPAISKVCRKTNPPNGPDFLKQIIGALNRSGRVSWVRS